MQDLVRREIDQRGIAVPAVDTPHDVASAVAEVAGAIGGAPLPDAQSAEALLAAIYAAPDDDDLRLVYADACIARGDPRGELIAVAAARASGRRPSSEQREREKALLRQHRSEWLGDLERVLLSSSIRFRLGFLDAATLKPKHDAHVRAVIGDVRWSTLRDLEVRAVADYHHAAAAAAARSVEELVRHDVMGGLRRLTGDLSGSLVIDLCEGELERRLEALQVALWDDQDDALRSALSSASRLPALRELICGHARQTSPADYHWLLRSGLARRLSRVELRMGLVALADWIAVCRAHAFDVLCITDTWGYDRFELARAGGHVTVRAYFRWPGMELGARGSLLRVADTLAGLEPGSIERVEVGWTRTDPATEAQRAALEAALAHLAPKHVKLPKQ